MNIVKAWKDPDYRATLSEEQLAGLPVHPCGVVDLGDEVLAHIAGATTEGLMTIGCCGGFTARETPCGSCRNTCNNYTCQTCAGQSTCTVCTA
ncbi:mersacidin/lichenicidin family type 2 lantibiotic [Catellatospora sp. NPDC049609]|jgi:mersacidin/lichenicidin family type 2 lantibiotic|uniref:mersacidin/lichenicidin family type 2 lantibiotic n=1 Tax=Catellatospora sp. NPDC049609 TaxID=3155505 RepID=UPI00342C08ED